MLRYATAMTRTPVDVDDAFYEQLVSTFGEEPLLELTATIAQENFRARMNRPLRIEATGFSQGAFCPMPER